MSETVARRYFGDPDLARVCEFAKQADKDSELLASGPFTGELLSVACFYWEKYPEIVALIGDERREAERYRAYVNLNRAHRQAAEVLIVAADREGIDGQAIWTAAGLCRHLFKNEPWKYRDGEYVFQWPDCLGKSRLSLPADQRQAIDSASAAYALLIGRYRAKPATPDAFDFEPPPSPRPRGRRSTKERDKKWAREYAELLEKGEVQCKVEFARIKGVKPGTMNKAIDRGEEILRGEN